MEISDNEKTEILELLDHVNSLVLFCGTNMLDTKRFHRGEKAMWAVAHRIAGDDYRADLLIKELGALLSS